MQGSAAGLAAMAMPLRAQAQLRLPEGPLTLTRELTRDLRDGKRIRVTRQWAVTFQRNARSIKVSGYQTSVRVDAPDRLRRLAQIEEERDASGLFPIILSENGTIMMGGRKDDDSSLAKAVETASAMIAGSNRSAPDKAAAQQHLGTMQRASQPILDTMPKDLFFPQNAPIHDVRPVSLPDGGTGEFELTFSARAAEGGAWLSRAERRITTRLGADERHSTEVWTLQPSAEIAAEAAE